MVTRERPSERPQRRKQLALGPADELVLLLGADLDQRNLCEAGVEERFDRVDVLLDVGTARDRLGDVLGPDELGRAVERLWIGQVRVDLPTQPEPPELLV